MPAFRAASPEQAAFLRDVLAAGLLVETGVPGVYGLGVDFVKVGDAFIAAVERTAAPDDAEAMRFPPAMPRRHLETNGYLGSFPHLAGTIFAFDGSDSQALDLEARAMRHEDWSEFQAMTDLVLTPAACYPVYPEIAKRGALRHGGATIDTGGAWVFRHEASDDPARLQVFRMYELIRIAAPNDVVAFRESWLARARDLLLRVGLETTSDLATDPFFGRVGRLLAANQRAQELKFELLATISGSEPTAVASFNYHQDHFTQAYGIGLEDGGLAHSGCVGFGIERITLALFRAHGMALGDWPQEVRAELWA